MKKKKKKKKKKKYYLLKNFNFKEKKNKKLSII